MVSSLCLLLGALALSATIVNGQQTELEVVPHVDLNRYAGRWYEIARLPNRFEKKCADSVTATYSLRTDGKVEVVDRIEIEADRVDVIRPVGGGLHVGDTGRFLQ